LNVPGKVVKSGDLFPPWGHRIFVETPVVWGPKDLQSARRSENRADIQSAPLPPRQEDRFADWSRSVSGPRTEPPGRGGGQAPPARSQHSGSRRLLQTSETANSGCTVRVRRNFGVLEHQIPENCLARLWWPPSVTRWGQKICVNGALAAPIRKQAGYPRNVDWGMWGGSRAESKARGCSNVFPGRKFSMAFPIKKQDFAGLAQPPPEKRHPLIGVP